MRVAVDANVIVRAIMRDDQTQADVAIQILRSAELVAVPLSALCEFAWVLGRTYGIKAGEIAAAIRALTGAENVETNGAAVEAGLAVLEVGGDFADGVIAYEGAWLGGERFVSFDKKAVELLTELGRPAELL